MAALQTATGVALGATTIGATLAGVTSGSLLTIQLSYYYSTGGGGQAAPSAPAGWTVAYAPVTLNYAGSAVGTATYFRDGVSSGGHSPSITLPPGSFGFLTLCEFSGTTYPAPVSVDRTAINQGTAASTTAWDTGTTAATTTAVELVLVQVDGDEASGSADIGLSTPPATGYTETQRLFDATVNEQGAHGYKEVASTGTQTGSWTKTATASAQVWQATVVTLMAVAAGPPVITAQPKGQTVREGLSATFTVAATFSGTGPTYQWKKNGANVGTNSATYTETAAIAANGAQITADVSDSNGSVTSGVAFLYVLRVPVEVKAQPRGAGTTFDYSPGGWFGIQAGTTPAGMFDQYMILPVSTAGHTAVAADTISFSDSAVAVSTLVAAASDTLTLSDSAVSFTNRVTVASDTVAFSDSAVAVNAFEAVGADTVSFTDSAVAVSSLVAAASDTLTLSDSAAAITTRVAAASDTLTLTDSAVASSTLVAVASDTISFTDSGVASLGAGSAIADGTDTITFSDSAVAVSTLVAAAADTIAFTDSAVAASTLPAVASDSVTFTDSAIGSSQYPAVAADTVAFSDSATAITSRVADASDSLTLSDSAVALTTHVAIADDTIAFTDSAIASTSQAAVASDTITFTDSADATALTGVVFAEAFDGVNFSDWAQGYTFTPPPQTGGGDGYGGGGEGEGDSASIRERWRQEARAKIAANNAFIMSLVGAMIREYEDEETP